MMKKLVALCGFAILFATANAQTPITHEQKVLQDEDGTIFWNKNLPFFVKLSTNPDGNDGVLLNTDKAQPTEEAKPTFLDTEGVNWIRTKWEVDPSTGKTIYPEREVMWPVSADGIAPTTQVWYEFEGRYIIGGKVYYSGDLKIKLNAFDQTSGVDKIYYSMGDSYKEYTGEFKPNLEKQWNFKYYSVDRVGNAENPENRTGVGANDGQVSFTIDKSAPTTSLDMAGPKKGTILSPKAKLGLTFSDGDGAGVQSTYYSFNDGPKKKYYTDVALYQLPDGDHNVTYYSVDHVKNEESSKSYEFYLDKTAPEVSFSVGGDQHSTNTRLYVSGRSKLDLAGTDNKAGLNSMYFKIDNGNYATFTSGVSSDIKPGPHNIYYYGDDAVENKSAVKKQLFYVDTKAPTIKYVANGPQYVRGDTLFMRDITKFSITPYETGTYQSGVKKIDYQIAGQTAVNYTEEFTVSGDGLKKLKMDVYDNVDNMASSSQFLFVDNVSPEIFSHFSVEDIGSKTVRGETITIYPKEVQVFLAATDKNVGTKKVYYSVNGSSEKVYSTPIQYFKTGSNITIDVRALDYLGNESKNTISFSVEE